MWPLPGGGTRVRLSCVDEPSPGEKWAALAREIWPVYRRWFLKEGAASRPTYLDSRRELMHHMPELIDLYDELVELTGGSDLFARCLSLYCPTPYLMGCSQVAWPGSAGLLVRNYDYSPDLWDAVVFSSRWCGRRVIAMSDCLWGVLDGINDAGLAVSLAFGGRRVIGRGFGMPLILRYILEIAESTSEATEILTRVPSHMAYNVTVLDASGAYATVHVAPDRPAAVHTERVATNHQGEIEWHEHARLTRSLEREQHLIHLLRFAPPPGTSAPPSSAVETRELPELDPPLLDPSHEFLVPPLYSHEHDRARGTLYTARYDVSARMVTFLWPQHRLEQSIYAFLETELHIDLLAKA